MENDNMLWKYRRRHWVPLLALYTLALPAFVLHRTPPRASASRVRQRFFQNTWADKDYMDRQFFVAGTLHVLLPKAKPNSGLTALELEPTDGRYIGFLRPGAEEVAKKKWYLDEYIAVGRTVFEAETDQVKKLKKEANAQGAKPRFQGWVNPSERWQVDKGSVDMALLSDGAMERLGSRREASPAPATLRAAAPASGVMVNKTALIVSFLSVITLGGVTNKFAYQIKDVGDPAYPAHFFKKPWFLELLMFIGMTLSFPLYWAVESFSKPSKVANGTHSELLLTEEVKDRGWKVRALIFLPAMGDLVGSILSFTGLVYISNSTAQMLGSSIIIMVALNSYIFLGRRYNSIQYAGMFIVLASLLIVGYAADMAARDKNQGVHEASASEQAFGMFLCVLARVVNSIQFVLEEKVMGESGLHPFEVTGTEGVYGLLMTACVIMPILAYIPGSDVGGVFENTEDSLMMIQRNGTLDLVLFFYLLGLWGLNALGMMVMKHLGSVFRAVSRNMQALFVWLIDMALFYGLGHRGFGYGPVGEPWQGNASWIQVVGFIFMTAGVFVYAYGNAVQQVMAAQQEEQKGIPSPIPVAYSMRELALDLDPGVMPSPLAVMKAEFTKDNAFGDADMSRALRSGSMTPGAFATPGGRIKRVGSNAEMALVGL